MTKLQTVKGKTGLVLAVAAAAVVGGAMTAVVSAAIPATNDGKIHACYRTGASPNAPSGDLRVIDSQATPAQNCTAQETSLNWDAAAAANANSSVPILRDANGQVLGTPAVYAPRSRSVNSVYNTTLNRTIEFREDQTEAGDSFIASVGDVTQLSYLSTDCSGSAYIEGNGTTLVKTKLFRAVQNGSDAGYMIVQDGAQAVRDYVKSYKPSEAVEPSGCQLVVDDNPEFPASAISDYYPLSGATLPFSMPIALPLKF